MDNRNLYSIGIDLGTEETYVSCVDDVGHAEIVALDEASAGLPSVFAFNRGGEPVFGIPALTLAQADSPRLVSNFVASLATPEWTHTFGRSTLDCVDVTSIFLGEVLRRAHQKAGHIREAVVATPLGDDLDAKEVLVEAGRRIGLNVMAVISPMTSITLGSGHRLFRGECSSGDAELAFNDAMILGLRQDKTTFDVWLSHFQEDYSVTVEAKEEGLSLGTGAWDDEAARFVASEFCRAFGVDADSVYSHESLLLKATKMRRTLLRKQVARVRLEHGAREALLEITIDQYNGLTQRYNQRIWSAIKSVLQHEGVGNGGRGHAGIDVLAVSNGSSWIPFLRHAIDKEFGTSATIDELPLDIASTGAAVRAAQLSRENRNDMAPPPGTPEATQLTESDVPVQATLVVESPDHYTEWLDIPPGERPPSHYVLLGLDLYESDTEIIRQAADTQMKRIRPRCFKHPEKGTAILNEIAKARVCLIDQDRKNQYDHLLRHGPPKSVPQEQMSSSDLGTTVDGSTFPELAEESPMDYVPTATRRRFRLRSSPDHRAADRASANGSATHWTQRAALLRDDLLVVVRSSVAKYESWRRKCAEIDPRLESLFVRGTFASVACVVFLMAMLILSTFDSGEDSLTTEARKDVTQESHGKETTPPPEAVDQFPQDDDLELSDPEELDLDDLRRPESHSTDRGTNFPARPPEPSLDAEPMEPVVEPDSDKLLGYLLHVECRERDTWIFVLPKDEVGRSTYRYGPARRSYLEHCVRGIARDRDFDDNIFNYLTGLEMTAGAKARATRSFVSRRTTKPPSPLGELVEVTGKIRGAGFGSKGEMDVETIRIQGNEDSEVIVGRGRTFVGGSPPNRSPLDDLVRSPGSRKTLDIEGSCGAFHGDMHVTYRCDLPRSWNAPLEIDMTGIPFQQIRELVGSGTSKIRVEFDGEFTDEGEPVLDCTAVLQVARRPALPPPQKAAPKRSRRARGAASTARWVIVAISDKLIGGHFATEQQAEDQLDALRKKGYRPVVRPKRYPTVESAEKALQAKIPGWKPD